MVKTCGVEFLDNPQKICYAGQTISGRAIILLEEPKTVKKLKLQIYGYAYVSWSDSSKSSYFDTVCYLNNETTLMETSYSQSEFIIEPGRHTYDFQFGIPDQCPSSYEGFHGHIRYLVKIIFVRTVLDQAKVVPFTVINPLNLNTTAINLSLPVKEEITKKPWFSRNILMSASIPKTGYIPGENISVEISLRNHSSNQIKEVVVSLLLKTIYKTRTSVSTETETKYLSSVKIPKEDIKAEESYLNTSLTIPSVLPSSQDLCEILKVSYVVHIAARLSGLHINPQIALPCVIGTIPLGAYPKGGVHTNFLGDYEMELPTYEAATYMTGGRHLTTDIVDEKNFVPFVPCFNVK